MLSESYPIIRNLIRFIALPYCFIRLVNWKQCNKSPIAVFNDLLYIFFRLKYFPDNYSPCRLWEKDRSKWIYYYGSTYHPYQRQKLRKEVQRYEYQILFNDKEVCNMLCIGINVPMPRSYAVVETGSNYIEIIKNTFREFNVDEIIIKPIMGHAGRGIVMARRIDDRLIIINNKEVIELKNYKLKEKSLLQEVIKQHDRLSNISSSSVNTVRVVTLYTKYHEVLIISSSMRFGVGDAFVDNWSAGGVAVGVDLKTGQLMENAYDKLGNRYERHPISQTVFRGYQIPYWEDTLKMASMIQKRFSFYRLLGMDIAITKKGPVLIEINANPDIIFQEQTSGPLLADANIIREFEKYDLLINQYQKRIISDYPTSISNG